MEVPADGLAVLVAFFQGHWDGWFLEGDVASMAVVCYIELSIFNPSLGSVSQGISRYTVGNHTLYTAGTTRLWRVTKEKTY